MTPYTWQQPNGSADVGMQVEELQTYDSSLHKYAAVVDYKILVPYAPQPRLL